MVVRPKLSILTFIFMDENETTVPAEETPETPAEEVAAIDAPAEDAGNAPAEDAPTE